MQICNYSSLIFAGNVTVLLIVSMTTDYWEYRSFNQTMLKETLHKANQTEFDQPVDTNSYMSLWYKRKMLPILRDSVKKEILYQPPVLVENFFSVTKNISDSNKEKSADIHSNMLAGLVVLFEQYGNLFRDCDALEEGVRQRLYLVQKRVDRCEYLSGREIEAASDVTELIVVKHLERAACAFALLCMVSMVAGLITGAYGLFGHHTRVLVWASCCSLISGMLLTLAIALFHGKCYILRRTELLHGYRIPHKKIINESRTYSFGWSFYLAWICVFLCFTSSYVWLYKAQDPKQTKLPGVNYIRHRYRRGKYSYFED
ncbi:uncharacterized protein LOC134269761 [Saccostrea cucullata]|uniref:uncharacterized protein LOC134269761 n=1 Tax=Saccostrea cuccullata TaxID=36930 RepID=UPI002ED0779E